MKKKDIIYLVVLLIVIGISFYRFKNRKYNSRDSKILMDTIVDISITGKDKNIDSILDSTFALIQDLDDQLSYYNENSEVSGINNREKVELSDDLLKIMDVAGKVYSQSDSLYDVSVGALVDIWQFDRAEIPSQSAIETAQSHIGYSKIKIKNGLISIPEGMKINLGSLAKGYIIDQAVNLILSKGNFTGYVNAGGDIRYFGSTIPVKIGVQHPRNKNEIIETIHLTDEAVVTSGDYERFFMKNGVRYHHILNPETGFPAENTISVTVIAKTAIMADALSTAFFVMNPQDAVELSNKLPDVETMIYFMQDNEPASIRSAGFIKYIE